MTALRRLADWLRHAPRWTVATTAIASALAVAAIVAAGTGNRHRDGDPPAAVMATGGTPDVVTGADVPAATTTAARRTYHRTARRTHRAARRAHHRTPSAERAAARRAHRRGRHGGARRSGATGHPGAMSSSGSNAPVIVGTDVIDAAATDRFFRQYDVDAGTADGRAAAEATVAWINRHGGIAGRPLSLRVRQFNFYGAPVSVQDEATCAAWSAGDKPIADIDAHASTDILIPCLRRHGIASLVNGTTPPASADFAAAGAPLYAPGSPALDRVQTAYVTGLRDAGFFARGARVGLLLSTNLPQLEAGGSALKRALGAAGVQARDIRVISLEDPASFFASEASAVLHFRLAKIDHVIALDQDGLALGQFMRGAEAEDYRPVYGISSTSAPAFLAAGSSPRQLRRAIGVGWSPLLDVQAADDPGGGSTRATCASIFAAAGVRTGGRTPFGQYAAHQTCDSLMALRAARATSPQTLRAGMDGLAESWRSGLTLGTWIGPGRRDGAAAWRLLRYADGCRCFRYDGPTRPL